MIAPGVMSQTDAIVVEVKCVSGSMLISCGSSLDGSISKSALDKLLISASKSMLTRRFKSNLIARLWVRLRCGKKGEKVHVLLAKMYL